MTHSVISVRICADKPDEYTWCGDSDILALSPDFVEIVGLDVLPWKLEYLRDEDERKLYRRI
jgi:hypothetical protein